MNVSEIRAFPKVALHEHLDGAIRPATMLDIANRIGHPLPATDEHSLAAWCFSAADSGSLVKYLKVFEHTVAVMQTQADLTRIAREFVVDQALDGVTYVETRWAPEQHTQRGLTMRDAVLAVRDGLSEGMDEAKAMGHPIRATQLLTAMRHTTPTTEIAQLALTFRHDSVAGFDIAGPELGFPPTLHRASFDLLRREYLPITIHAGEAAGIDSIKDALANGALRIGHGVRLIDDFTGGTPGAVAQWIIDRQIALEICPTSNVQTGVCDSVANHPIAALDEAGCRIAVSCDNRLLGNTTLSDEFAALGTAFGYKMSDVSRLTRNAARAAFLSHEDKMLLLERIG